MPVVTRRCAATTLRRALTCALLLLAAVPLASAGEAAGFSPWRLFGRLHVLVVHFPVGLLLVAALVEVVHWKRKEVSETSLWFVFVGALSAVFAAAMGWANGDEHSDGGLDLFLHRWLGVGTAVLACVTAGIALRLRTADYGVLPRRVFRVLLFATAMAVGATGHFGGNLVHGPDYVTSALPAWLKAWIPAVPERHSDGATPAGTPAVDPDALTGPVDFTRDIEPIFKKSCYECHNDKEQKGKLRMDSRELLLKGGENGPGFEAGNGDKSAIIQRIRGEGDDPRMPKKKPPLNADQTEVIKRWIDQGAVWGKPKDG